MEDRLDGAEVTGSERYRRPWGLYLVVALVAVAVALGAVAKLGGNAGPPQGTTSAASSSPSPSPPVVPAPPSGEPGDAGSATPVPDRTSSCDVALPGLVLGRGAPRGYAVNTWNCAAGDGPRALVVRRSGDGSLGQHGAVVTFPVNAMDPGALTSAQLRHGIRGWWSPGTLVWMVDGQYARVRGDLPARSLAQIAHGITRQHWYGNDIRLPAGLKAIAWSSYGSVLVRGVRYGAADVGESAALGDGLVYTAVMSGGGFEDRLYATHVTPAGVVRGHRAVISDVEGGSATIAWEPRPGTVALVGYSGAARSAATDAALRRLAARTELGAAQVWRHRSGLPDTHVGLKRAGRRRSRAAGR